MYGFSINIFHSCHKKGEIYTMLKSDNTVKLSSENKTEPVIEARWKLIVDKRWLLLVSGLMWSGVGVMLDWRAILWLRPVLAVIYQRCLPDTVI